MSSMLSDAVNEKTLNFMAEKYTEFIVICTTA